MHGRLPLLVLQIQALHANMAPQLFMELVHCIKLLKTSLNVTVACQGCCCVGQSKGLQASWLQSGRPCAYAW